MPRGTANLVAHALGVPFGLEAALAVGFGGHERQVDLAVADGRTFVAMAGMGLDAAVVQATPALLKEHLGWLGYAVAGLSCLHGQPHEFEVRLDGGEPLSRRAQTVVVGNVGILPGGFVLLPGARLDDGLLDVGIVSPEGPLGWALLAGRVLAAKRARRWRGGQSRALRRPVRRTGTSSTTRLTKSRSGPTPSCRARLTARSSPQAVR